MSKGSNTTTTSQTPTALPAYQGAIGQLQNVAATPYTPYGGQLVSPVNEQQQTGIGGINQNAYSAIPYLTGAESTIQGAAQPLTQGQIQNYQSPYTQDVINATMANFANSNAQQQQQVLGNAAAQGALGGDRTAVAQSVLAGQQQQAEAPTIAGLENTGYGQAVNLAMQQYQQNPEQAAYGMASTGTALENAGLTGANAQVGAGTLEQQTQQAQDTAAYQQFMQQQFMPESMLSWELPLLTGVGSQEGGTGTTTGPAPNPWSQIIGAGIGAGAAVLSDKRAKENIRKIGKLFDGQNIYRFNYKGTPTTHVGLLAQEVEKDNPDAVHEFHNVKAVDLDAATRDAARRFGGRIQGLQGGGVPGAFSPGGANPWLNYAQMPGSTNTPKPPQLPGQQQTGLQSPQQMIANAAKIAPSLSSGIGNIFNTGTTELSSGMNAGDLSALTGEDADVSSAALAALPFGEKRGGRVPVRAGLGMASFMPRRRYASGGSDDSGDEDTVNFPSQRFVQPPMPAGLYNNSAGEANPLENILKFQTYGLNSPYAPAASTDETPRTAANDELPSEITRGASAVAPQSGIGVSAMSFADDGSRNAPSVAPPDSVNAGPAQAAGAPVRSGITSERNFGLLGLLPQDVGVAALTAGLGMMASRSPFLGTAIGEGGLQGLSTYSGLKKQEQDVDLKVRQLDQAVKQESDRMALEAKKINLAEQAQTFGQTGISATERAKLAQAQQQYERQLNAPRVMTPGQELVNPVTGKTIATNESGLMTDAAVNLAVDRIHAGDPSALQNLGRGAQTGQNLTRIQNRLAERAANEGWSGADLAAAKANFTSQSAAASMAAKRESTVQSAVEEAKNTFPLAEQASAALPRSSFVPWNKAVQMVQAGTSSPELARYVTSLRGAITAYSQAMSRTGTNSVYAQGAAEHLLEQASGPEAIKATLDQMRKEMDAAVIAPETVRQAIMARIAGRPAPPPVQMPGAIAPQSAKPPAMQSNGWIYKLQPDGSYNDPSPQKGG